jgi:soluble cytochrome b562
MDGGENSDLTFVEPPRRQVDLLEDANVPVQDKSYYEKEWGKGLDLEAYQFLDNELQEYFKTTKHDSHNEVILLKEICFIENEIRKARLEGGSVTALQKSLQEYMKGCNLTPATQAMVSSSQSVESFGVWLKDIEQTTPAEWWEDQERYRDMDGFREDIDDLIRSTGKFVNSAKDFNLDNLEESDEIETEEPVILGAENADIP